MSVEDSKQEDAMRLPESEAVSSVPADARPPDAVPVSPVPEAPVEKTTADMYADSFPKLDYIVKARLEQEWRSR